MTKNVQVKPNATIIINLILGMVDKIHTQDS